MSNTFQYNKVFKLSKSSDTEVGNVNPLSIVE